MRLFLYISLIALVLTACGPKQPDAPDAPTAKEVSTVPTPAPSPKPAPEESPTANAPLNTLTDAQLVDEWLRIAKDPEHYKGDPRPFAICNTLDGTDPTALAPFIKLLDHPDTSSETKVFILQNIHFYMDADYIPTLLPLLESQDATTRSCTTTLLGGITHDSVTQALLRMKQDPDSRVAFAAWSGLAQQNQAPYRREFIDHYTSPDINQNQRAEIIRILLKGVHADDETIATSIITASDTDPTARKLLVMALADVGTASSIQALNDSISLDPSEEYRLLVESSIAVIKERSAPTQ